MEKRKNVIILLLSMFVIGLFGFLFFQKTESSDTKNRVVEENVEVIMQGLLAEKYSKPLNEVKTRVIKKDDTHVAGSVMFGEGGPGAGGLVLMIKQENAWKLLYDGNGSVNCNELRQKYGFSDEILRPNFCD